MKTTKRKRASKAEAAGEAAAVDTVDGAVAVVPEETSQTATETVAVAEAAEPAVEAAPPAGDPVIVLSANCSVKDAAALKTSLIAVAKAPAPVTVDVRALERVDTATLQLLCAFVIDRNSRQQGVTWLGESQALQDAAKLLGVRTMLGFEAGVAA